MRNKKEIISLFFEEVYNNNNFDIINELFAPNYYEHREDGARSNTDAIEIIKSAITSFPDLNVEINDILEEADLIAVRVTFKGTHRQSFIGVEATNKVIVWEAMEFFRIHDNVVTESWGAWPLHDMINDMITN